MCSSRAGLADKSQEVTSLQQDIARLQTQLELRSADRDTLAQEASSKVQRTTEGGVSLSSCFCFSFSHVL